MTVPEIAPAEAVTAEVTAETGVTEATEMMVTDGILAIMAITGIEMTGAIPGTGGMTGNPAEIRTGDGHLTEVATGQIAKWKKASIAPGITTPKKEKRCLKCMKERDHHEFKCPLYMRRSKFNCRNCNAGFHFPEECSKQPTGQNRLSPSGNN